MKCPTCNTENPASAIQCQACSSPLVALAALQDVPTIAPETRARPSGAHEQWPEREDDCYRVEELAGQGGMGEVWIVRDTRNGLRRCLKRPSRASGSDLARFLAEIEILKGKLCGDIVPCIDYGRDRKGPFLIMPYYQRGSLQKRIAEEGPLKGTAIFDLAKAIGRALCHLHQANVLHRDVKPANILLTDDGQPCLADFGLARTDENGSTEAQGPVGTANYMAPEVSRGQPASALSDIYSLGVTLRFAITGCPPGAGRDNAIPEPWRGVVLRCTEASPDKRYQSAADFLATVDSLRFSSSSGTGAPCPDCGADTVKGANRCTACNAALTEACGSCMSSIPRGTVNCTSCGANVPTWNQMRALREQAAGLVEEGQLARAAALLDKILEVLPAARGLTLTIREQIVRLGPALSRLRREARKLEYDQGPVVAEPVWRRVLDQCPKDKEALDALQSVAARQAEFRFELGAGEVRQACADLDLEAAEFALDQLRELADTPARTAACERLTRQVEEAREALLQALTQSFAQAVGSGNFPGALGLLEQCQQQGMSREQVAALRVQVAKVKRGVWRRDLVVGGAALALAALGSLWFVKHMQANAETRVLAAFAADDHEVAIGEATSMFLPTALARGVADDARKLRGGDAGAASLSELLQMEQRWRTRRDCEVPPATMTMFGRRIDHAMRQQLGLPSGDAPVRADDGILRLPAPDGATIAVQFDDRGLSGPRPGEFEFPVDTEDGAHQVALQVNLDGVERTLPLRVELRRAPLQLALLGAPSETALVGTAVEVRVEVLHAYDPARATLDVTPGDPTTTTISTPPPTGDGRWQFRVTATNPGVVELTLLASEGPRTATLPLRLTFEAEPTPPPPPAKRWELNTATPSETAASRLEVSATSNADEVTLLSGADDTGRRFDAAANGTFRIVADLTEGPNRFRIVARYGDEKVEQARWQTTLDSTAPRLISAPPKLARVGATITLRFDEVVAEASGAAARAAGETVTLTAPSSAGEHRITLTVADRLGNSQPVSLALTVFDVTTIATLPTGATPLQLCSTDRDVWAVSSSSLRALGTDAAAPIENLDIRHFAAAGDQLAWLDDARRLHFVASANGPHRVSKVLMPDEVCLGLALAGDQVLLFTDKAQSPGNWRVRMVDPHLQTAQSFTLNWRPKPDDRVAQLVIRDSRWALRTANGDFLWNATQTGGIWNEEQNHWTPGDNGKRVEVAATAIAAGGPADSLLLAATDGQVWLRVRRQYQVLTKVDRALTCVCGGHQRWIGTDGSDSCVLGRYEPGSSTRVELPGPALSVAFLGPADAERPIALLQDGRVVSFEQ